MSAVSHDTSFLVISRQNVLFIFTKFGMQDNWFNSLLGRAFECKSYKANLVITDYLVF